MHNQRNRKKERAEVNYFDDNTTGQNDESSPEDAEQTIQLSKDIQVSSAQTSTVNTRVTKNPLESLKSDTGHTSRQQLSVCTSAEEIRQQLKTSTEDVEQDVEAPYPTADTSEEMTLTQSERLHTLPTSTDEVRMPTEKVGCMLVTSHLKQFLENFLRHISHAIIVRQIFV